jgi:uncharacterized RDD family membrane protein YckC
MAKGAPMTRAAAKTQARILGDSSLRAMVTPEGVKLDLDLAEVSQRAGALVLDLLIIGAGYIVLGIVCLIALRSLGWARREPVLIVWIAAGFLLRNAYFIAFEIGPRAATPGKRRMGLRVAARNGGRLTADAIFVRNVLRELELYLPMQVLFMPGLGVDAVMKALAVAWCAIFVLLPLFNRDRLRAGDLLAGTWVIKVPARRLLPDLARAGVGDRVRIAFTDPQLDAYGIKELQVLEDVLRRFDRKAVAVVADRIRRKIGYVQGEESDGAFLNAYYAALRLRLESRALLGRRRADKHDRG